MNKKVINKEVDEALQDIHIIKETLRDAKVRYRGIYLMCFLMAAFNGVKYLWTLLQLRFMPGMLAASFMIHYIWPLLLVVSFLCLYRNEKGYSNKYYLSMIGIWGFMAGVIPAMTALVDVISLFIMNGQTRSAAQIGGSDFMESISNMLLFSILLVICAYILENRFFMVLAILNLLCYMILETCFTTAGIPFPMDGQKQVRLACSSVYSITITCPGYLALGIYLRGRQAKSEEHSLTDRKEQNRR